jgi:pantetheine-phosphate adenylyltransferase
MPGIIARMALTALFPGTFDPLTLGHADLVTRASRLFDRLIVAVAASPRKGTLFSLDERVELARESFRSLTNVEVKGFSSLLAAYANEQRANVIIRGVRTVADFEYEMQMVGVNRTLNPALEVIFLTPDPKFGFVSSTHVREVTLHGGDASPFVAPQVWRALQAKRPA